jgi:hypothetical protein
MDLPEDDLEGIEGGGPKARLSVAIVKDVMNVLNYD